MAKERDAPRTPTKRPSSSSSTTTPRSSRKNNLQRRPSIEVDLPLPPQTLSDIEATNLDASFLPLPPPQAASIYSVNRATLSGHLSQLTCTDLPDADTLAAAITALPTASEAAKALNKSAKQIKSWIRTAAEVLGGLDAQDDVDWAGSGSKDGVVDVEVAIKKFEKLVVTYITAVEDAQKRPDIKSVPKEEMTTFLDTLDDVISAWERVKSSLTRVKSQNDLAIEWEDLWNTTLGEIGQEIEELSTLVFELEEKRYTGGFDDKAAIEHATAGVDMKDLETIVEETPGLGRGGPLPAHLSSPIMSPALQDPSEDAGLLTLFARMQPLRASLDFLPIKLTSYETKAGKTFPSACSELRARRETLETKYKVLETDAETLRRELGEDKWVVVFRTAARQAQMMCESIDKGIQKLRETLKDEGKASNVGLLAKRISDYEAKRNNYGPAIQKVLFMIGKGVKDRATINGEIIRIHEQTQHMWTDLEERLRDTDAFLDEAQASRSQQLRDSISTIMSTDMSGFASNTASPASSIASSPPAVPTDKTSIPATPDTNLIQSRNSSIRSLSASRPVASKRVVSQTAPTPASTRRSLVHPSPMSRLSTASPSPAARSNMTPLSTIPSSRTATPGTATTSKPRWSMGGAVDRKLLDAKPTFTPTAYARRLRDAKPSVYSVRSTSGPATSSALPSPSPLGASTFSAARQSTGRVVARAASSLGIRSSRDVSPNPSHNTGSARSSMHEDILNSRPRSRLYRPSLPAAGTSTPSAIRVSSIGSRNGTGMQRKSLLPLPSETSPSIPSVLLDETSSIDGSIDFLDDDTILPSIEDDEPASPTPVNHTRRVLPTRPASSLARTGGISSNGPVVAHNRASLLRLGSLAPTGAKPRWR